MKFFNVQTLFILDETTNNPAKPDTGNQSVSLRGIRCRGSWLLKPDPNVWPDDDDPLSSATMTGLAEDSLIRQPVVLVRLKKKADIIAARAVRSHDHATSDCLQEKALKLREEIKTLKQKIKQAEQVIRFQKQRLGRS